MQCTSVGAAGTADLTLASGRCSYAYRTPAGTERPPDVPVGVSTDYPCAVELAVDAGVTQPDVRVARRSLDLCRIHHAVRPPACTFAAAWERALAAGAPRDAVARVRFAGRYQSGYDPVDPADDFDVPERGRWSVEIARDGQDDLRYEFRDDCGAPPPSADAQALRAEVTKARPALARCLTKAVGGALVAIGGGGGFAAVTALASGAIAGATAPPCCRASRLPALQAATIPSAAHRAAS